MAASKTLPTFPPPCDGCDAPLRSERSLPELSAVLNGSVVLLGSLRVDLLSPSGEARPPAIHSKVAKQATAHGQLLGLTESAGQYSL